MYLTIYRNLRPCNPAPPASTPWREDLAEPVLRPVDAHQVRIAQPARVSDAYVAVVVARAHEQHELRPFRGGGDRLAQAIGRECLAADRDQPHAGSEAGLEGGAVPSHVGDAAVARRRDETDRIGVVRTFVDRLHCLLEIVRLVLVDQLPAGGADAVERRRMALHAFAQEAGPV